MDVKKLLSQLERSEKARSEVQSRLTETSKTLSDLKEASERHFLIKEKLQVRYY